MQFEIKPIGRVESSLTDLAAAPRQADEGAPPGGRSRWQNPDEVFIVAALFLPTRSREPLCIGGVEKLTASN